VSLDTRAFRNFNELISEEEMTYSEQIS